MINAEKYKKEIMKISKGNYDFAIDVESNKIRVCTIDKCGNCLFKNKRDSCGIAKNVWLLAEYRKPTLDAIEKEYLIGVIRPFRDKIEFITKWHADEVESIVIKTSNSYFYNYIILPEFKAGTMYKGIKTGKGYSVEELGL